MITPGGEITKRRAFVKIADLPTDSFGLAATESSIYVFGRNAIPTVPTLPSGAGITLPLLKGLKVPNAAGDLIQTDYDVFNGRIYLACSQASGSTAALKNPHYYDDGKTASTMIASTEGNGKGKFIRTFQSKMYAVAGSTVGNESYLYFSALENPTIWEPSTTLTNVVVTSLSNTYPARCTVAAADITKFTNGQLVTVSGANAEHAEANGVHSISAVNTPANTFILDDVDCSGATAAQTAGVKVDPRTTAGRGFINLGTQDADSEKLTALEVYYDKLAVFSTQAIQIWAVDPDPLQNAYQQLLRGSGTHAPASPLQYGTGDVLFLDHSGVRSMKARDSSNSASVSDIGSPIDSIIAQLTIDLGVDWMANAVSVLEPYVGRFWLVLPDRIYVLSYFPGPKISAWSQFTLPFTVQYVVQSAGRILFRDTSNQLWVYGGANGNVYGDSASRVEVRLPYLDGKKPGHNKQFLGFDVTLSGVWEARVSYDYNNPASIEEADAQNPTSEESLGTFSKPSWIDGRAEMVGVASHFSLRFYAAAGTSPGNGGDKEATISNCAAHYEMADAEA